MESNSLRITPQVFVKVIVTKANLLLYKMRFSNTYVPIPISAFNIKMGSGLSYEADTQHTEISPTKLEPPTHENHQTAKTTVTAPLKYSIDTASNGNCFLVFARDLSIAWSEYKCYWHWPSIKETSEDVFIDVAELLNVCWLDVRGKFEMEKLTAGIKYEVVFMVMLKDPAYGWEIPINVRLVLPDGNKQEHKENMVEKPRSRWFEIPVGEFTVEPKNGGFIEFSLYEHEVGAWKRGLLVKCAAIRPKK